MKNRILFTGLLCALSMSFFVLSAAAQSPLVKRTNSKTDSVDFGAGGTITINGAPNGSIKVEGWANNKIEVTAEIEVQGASEADVALLSSVSGYLLDASMGSASIVSLMPDKKSLRAKDKKFKKELLTAPFKIDYVIKVPRFADLEINGGVGDLSITGVDGRLFVNFLKTNALLELVGGSANATFASGTVDVIIPSRSWRGRSADIQLASGTMNVQLPASLNADVDGGILRSGKIENTFAELKQRERNMPFTEKAVIAKAGSGGIPLKFTVGDGTLNIMQTKK